MRNGVYEGPAMKKKHAKNKGGTIYAKAPSVLSCSFASRSGSVSSLIVDPDTGLSNQNNPRSDD
jgi:hypothetical protein